MTPLRRRVFDPFQPETMRRLAKSYQRDYLNAAAILGVTTALLILFFIYRRSLGFPVPVTPLCEALFDLHNFIFILLTFVFAFVSSLLLSALFLFWFQQYFLWFSDHAPAKDMLDTRSNYRFRHQFTHNEPLEFAWSTIPGLLLFLVGMASIRFIYIMDEIVDPHTTLKIVGHQWYWTYEYDPIVALRSMPRGTLLGDLWQRHGSDYEFLSALSVSSDSYLVPSDPLGASVDHLLRTDFEAPLPMGVPVRILVTSSDVIHSWALPAAGTKVDAIPGRLNQSILYFTRLGTFSGQCSELCGAQHGFMPIRVRVLPPIHYWSWLSGEVHVRALDFISKRP